MRSNLIGLEEWRSYGNLQDWVSHGGVSFLFGNTWLGSTYWALATKDAINMNDRYITLTYMTYGFYEHNTFQGGIACLNIIVVISYNSYNLATNSDAMYIQYRYTEYEWISYGYLWYDITYCGFYCLAITVAKGHADLGIATKIYGGLI